jgi:LysM repeat protein
MSTCAAERMLAVAALCCLAAAVGPPSPSVLKYKVKSGDTLGALALQHYGDKERAAALARINGLPSGRPLRIGQILRIPLTMSHRVRPGDTASRLAEKHLGGASRHALLAEMNGLAAGASLAAGAQLEIPALLEHTVQRGETLGVVAKRYYGDSARASWLVTCNGIEKPDAVQSGTKIQVPLTGFLPEARKRPVQPVPAEARAATRARKPEKTVPDPPQPRKETATPAAAAVKRAPPAGSASESGKKAQDPAVARAIELYRQGEYRKAGELFGAALDSGALPAHERVRALRFRAFCAAATGDRVEARRLFQKLHKLAPQWKPDPVQDSPKLRQIFSEAVGAPVASKSPS